MFHPEAPELGHTILGHVTNDSLMCADLGSSPLAKSLKLCGRAKQLPQLLHGLQRTSARHIPHHSTCSKPTASSTMPTTS